MNPISQRALDATARYQRFTDQLRSQFDYAMRDDPTHGATRVTAKDNAQEIARAWLADEIEVIRSDTYGVGTRAYEDAIAQTAISRAEAPTDLQGHFGNTSSYLLDMLAAQASRDISTMVRAIEAAGIRIDMATRAGQLLDRATAAVILDPAQGVRFSFIDRAGRVYSSAKHVRDQYRLQLLLTQNDAFLYAMSEAGIDQVEIRNPSPQNKWDGQVIMVHAAQGDTPSYYDIRDEVFHPSSDAYLSTVE